mgnify:CR=1 FL=1
MPNDDNRFTYNDTHDYDGYQDILNNIKGIIKTEALTEMQKESLLSKIKNFEIVIEETLSGRADEAERAYREAKSGEA